MSRRTELRKEVIEEEVTFIQCDICKEEIPKYEHRINSGDFQQLNDAISRAYNTNRWWKNPLDTIVGITKGSASNNIEYTPDFDVHVRCGYDAIKEAVEKQA